MGMIIRHAAAGDIDMIAAVEAECFPLAEAATAEAFVDRVNQYGEHFYLMFEDGQLVSFIDGFVTDIHDLTDEMFERADMHNESGAWQMLFGVNTIPEYRRQGRAGILICKMIEDAKAQGRKGLVLTAKAEKIKYYAKFGFKDEGVTVKSKHGGVPWHQMRLEF